MQNNRNANISMQIKSVGMFVVGGASGDLNGFNICKHLVVSKTEVNIAQHSKELAIRINYAFFSSETSSPHKF